MVFQAPSEPEQQELGSYHEELSRQLAPEPGVLESLNDRVLLGAMSTPTFRAGSLGYAKRQANPDEPKLSPKELNERYPGMEVPFNEPLPESVAQTLSLQQEVKHRAQETIERGPQSKLLAPLNFVAGVLPALLDPTFLAAGIATGGLADLAGVGSAVTAAEGAGFLERGVTGAAHAAASMAAPEAASGVMAGYQHENYGLRDYAENIAGAAALAGVGHAALPPAVRFLKRTLGGKPDALAQQVATSQLIRGKNVDVEPIVGQLTGEMNGAPPAGPEFRSTLAPYEYRPIDTSAPVSGKFYHGSEPSLGDLNTVEHSPLELELGTGLYLTDNPQVANGVSARGLADAPGKIREVALDGAKLLDLEKPLPDDLRASLPGAGDDVPAKEVLSRLTGPDLGRLEAQLKEQGYDGYRHEGGKFLGAENDPHNIVKLFDPESPKAQVTSELAPEAQVTQQPSREELQAVADHQGSHASDRLFDETEHAELQHAMNHPAEETDLNDAQVHHADEMETLKAILDQGHLEPEAAAEVQALQDEIAESPEKESAFKSYMNCLIGAFRG